MFAIRCLRSGIFCRAVAVAVVDFVLRALRSGVWNWALQSGRLKNKGEAVQLDVNYLLAMHSRCGNIVIPYVL